MEHQTRSATPSTTLTNVRAGVALPPEKTGALAKLVAPPPNLPLAPEEKGAPMVKSPAAFPAPKPAAPAPAPAPVVMPPPVVTAPLPPPPAVETPVEDLESVELPELSEDAIAFLTSKRYRESQASVTTAFDLTPDDLSFLNEMDHMVLGGTLTIDAYIEALRAEFPALSKEKKEALIGQLVAERFIPWGDTLTPSAQNAARSAGLTLPVIPYYAIYTKPLTYNGAAGEVARSAGIPLAGQVQERLRDLLMSRVKGIRVDAQIEDQLMRRIELGGLGLEPEKARAVTIAMNDIMGRVHLMTEEAYTAWLAEDMKGTGRTGQSTEASEPQSAASVAPSAPSESDADAAEIAAQAARMPTPARNVSTALTRATGNVMSRIAGAPKDDYLRRRLENIISTRLRDVRSRNEILLTLMRDSKVGGMGMDKAQAEVVATAIEQGYSEFHAQILQEEQGQRETLLQEQARKVEERRKREAEEHARWYEEKVRNRNLEETSRQEITERMRAAASGFAAPVEAPHPLDVKERIKEKTELGDLVTPVPTSPLGGLGVLAPDAPKSATAFPPATPMPTITPPAPISTVRISTESARAAVQASSAPRPRMDDIKVVSASRTRLAGPLEELQELTLAGFRRLGKTPAEASARIQGSVDLLTKESFDQRVAAIRAWQASPLQKLYLNLVTEAFASGSTVQALIERKRAAGEDVPTSEEISAIIDLNGMLHF